MAVRHEYQVPAPLLAQTSQYFRKAEFHRSTYRIITTDATRYLTNKSIFKSLESLRQCIPLPKIVIVIEKKANLLVSVGV